jgi:hypothetical protein
MLIPTLHATQQRQARAACAGVIGHMAVGSTPLWPMASRARKGGPNVLPNVLFIRSSSSSFSRQRSLDRLAPLAKQRFP